MPDTSPCKFNPAAPFLSLYSVFFKKYRTPTGCVTFHITYYLINAGNPYE